MVVEKAVRPRLDAVAIAFDSADDAADARLPFEQDHLGGRSDLLEPIRQRQSRNATADDRNPGHRCPLRPVSPPPLSAFRMLVAAVARVWQRASAPVAGRPEQLPPLSSDARSPSGRRAGRQS